METEEKNTSITIWKIANYSYSWHTEDECITSEEFPICFKVDSFWRLKLYPRGVTASEGFTSIFLERQFRPDTGPESLSLDYHISVLDSDGIPKHTTGEKDCAFTKGETSGFSRLISRMDIIGNKSTCLPEDTLTVRCCISSESMSLSPPVCNLLKSTVLFRRHWMFWDAGEFNYQKPSELGIFSDFNIGYALLSLKQDYDSIDVRIERKDNDLGTFRYRIGILDSSQSTTQFLVDECIFKGEKQTVQTYLVSRSKLLRRHDLYLPEGRLILYCEIHYTFGHYSSIVEGQCRDKFFLSSMLGKKENSNNEDPSTADSRCCANNYDSLKNDFQNLYQEGTLSDFSIQVGSETLQVHKAVLCARSSVFKAILTNMEENKVDLSILGMDIVRRMLIFMYTDKADDLNWEMAKQLYSVANCYDITMLKRVCFEFLKLNLRSANVEDIRILANTHADKDLEKLVVEFWQRRN